MELQPTPTTLARIYLDHRTTLRKKLVREGVRFSDVDNVIHQMFCELHRDLAEDTDNPRDLVAWVYTAAHNKAVDYIRHHPLRAPRLHGRGKRLRLLIRQRPERDSQSGVPTHVSGPRHPAIRPGFPGRSTASGLSSVASGDVLKADKATDRRYLEADSDIPASWMGSPAFASPGDTLSPK